MPDDSPGTAARDALLSELEARMLVASLRTRLFQRPDLPVRLGRYRLLGRLGEGGMGTVFAAHDEQLDRRVAVKLLHTTRGKSGATPLARLRREAQALARLSHPNVVQVFEIDEFDGQAFVAMELVRGVTLRAWLAQRTRGLDEILEVFIQAGHGLAAAHAAGLVHRDFKPENVLVGGDGRVRVVDFGLVRGDPAFDLHDDPTPRPRDPGLTETGAVLGTPAYMAPEQAGGDLPVDARSDQYSLCVALHEALHGTRPGTPSTATTAIPGRVGAALRRGLKVDPQARFPTMHALLAALDRRPARARSRTIALAVIIAAVLVAAIAGVVAGVRAMQADRQQRAAEARLAAIDGRLVELSAAGEVAAGERLLADFSAAPELRGTDVGARAWARWAAALTSHGRPGRTAWANAYVQPGPPALRSQALLGLAEAYRRDGRWTGVASVLTLLAHAAPDLYTAPAAVGLRIDVAAALRDLPGALALASDPAAPPDRRALAPVLAQLVQMTATPHRDVFGARPLDGDRLLLDLRPPGQPAHHLVVAADRSLASRHHEPRTRMISAGHGWVVQDDGLAVALLAWTPEGLHEVGRWPGADQRIDSARAVDLDGDGLHEIYVADQGDLWTLARDDDGQWQRRLAHPATAAARSGGGGLVDGDLDGDGRPELVVALGPWRAYDLRVFQAAASGVLDLRARHKLGHTVGVHLLATPAGPRVVAVATGDYPNTGVFPEAHRSGAPKGIHILRLTADGLALTHSLPIPDDRIEDLVPGIFATGDLDGDGLDDLVLHLEHHATPFIPGRSVLLVARQLPAGDFAVILLGGIKLVALAQLDADPAMELLFNRGDDPTLWIAGTGDSVLPGESPPGLEYADTHARWLESAGAPDEVVALARVGVPELALSSATQVAALADEPTRRRLHLAAAQIAEDLRQPALAISLLADAAEDDALRPAALERLVADHLALGRHREAAEHSARWLAEPALSAETRARAAAIDGSLARLTASRAVVPLQLTTSAAEFVPAVLRRELTRGGLVIDSHAELTTAIAWPIDWPGERVVVEADLVARELQWSATFQVRLTTEARVLAVATIQIRGGDLIYEAFLTCGPATTAIGVPVRPDGAIDPLRLQLVVDPAQSRVECRLLAPDGAPRFTLDTALVAAPGPGRLHLEIGADPGFGAPTARAQVGLVRLELAGAALAGGPPRTAIELATAALVDGDPLAAISTLADLPGARAHLWRSVGLAELGRWHDAAAELRLVTLDPPLTRELRQLLRSRPATLGPVVRHALGERRYLELYRDTWDFALDYRRFTAVVLASLLGDLGVLERCGAPELCRTLLRARGRAHAQRGERARARPDLEAALTYYLADPETRQDASDLRVDLAVLAAGEDPGAALEHARAALALAPAPEICRDKLRARPELDASRDTAEWRALLGPDDRSLALAHGRLAAP